MKHSPFSHAFATTLALALLAPAARAHSHWLVPTEHILPAPDGHGRPPKTIVQCGWGDLMPLQDFPEPARLTPLRLVAPDGATVELPRGPGGFLATPITFRVAGAYWLTSGTVPTHVTRIDGKYGPHTYLYIPRTEAPAGSKIYWSQHVSGFAKSLVAVGATAAAEARVLAPLGLEFELVPLVNPAALVPGATLPIELRLHGRPAPAGIEIEATYAGYSYTLGQQAVWTGKTDATGRIALPLSRHGHWIVWTKHPEPPPPALAGLTDNLLWQTSLTFAVPEPAAPGGPGEKVTALTAAAPTPTP